MAPALATGGGGGGTDPDSECHWAGGRQEDKTETQQRDTEWAEEGATLEGVEAQEWAGLEGGAEREGVDL